MGEDANDTLTSTNITAEERKQYQSVTVKLDGFGRWLSSNGRDLAAAIRRESQWNSRLQRFEGRDDPGQNCRRDSGPRSI